MKRTYLIFFIFLLIATILLFLKLPGVNTSLLIAFSGIIILSIIEIFVFFFKKIADKKGEKHNLDNSEIIFQTLVLVWSLFAISKLLNRLYWAYIQYISIGLLILVIVYFVINKIRLKHLNLIIKNKFVSLIFLLLSISIYFIPHSFIIYAIEIKYSSIPENDLIFQESNCETYKRYYNALKFEKRNSKLKEIEEKIEKYCTEQNQDFNLLYEKARNNFEKNFYYEAISILTEIINGNSEKKNDSMYFVSLNDRATCYVSIGNYKAAKSDIFEALSIKPNYNTAYYNLGSIYYEIAEYDTALLYFNKAIELGKNNNLIYLQLGKTYYQLNKKALAIEYIDKSIIVDSTFANSYFVKGVILEKMNKTESACSCFKKAHELGDKNAKSKIEEICKNTSPNSGS